jgi:hypothetical protein
MTISSPGTYSGLNVAGTITVNADNVTITNSKIVCGGCTAVNTNGHNGTVISHTTMSGTDTGCGRLDRAAGNNATLLYDYVFHAVTGVNGGNDDIEHSYIITDGYCSGDHTEPILAADGNGPSGSEKILNNTLLNPNNQTADVDVGGPWGDLYNMNISGNMLGGGDFPLETGCSGATYQEHNTIIQNNRFTRLYYSNGGSLGTNGIDMADTSWSGNMWDDTLSPVAASPGGSGCTIGQK